jgi:hypothetical protein
MDYGVEYSDKNLRYNLIAGELRINTLDLCSILGIDPQGPETLDLAGAVQLALSHDIVLTGWLLETFDAYTPSDLEGPLAGLYSQMREYLREVRHGSHSKEEA